MADEQVGNNSFQTMTPGSAVAGQLQNILTQQRLEARQALLDSIHQKDVESQIKDRDENAATNAEYRKGLIANRQSQELQRRAALYSPHQALAPTDVDYFKGAAPSLVDPGQAPTDPLAPGEEGPTRPEVAPQFHGLPGQLENERKLKLQDDLQHMMADPTKWDPLPDAQKEALYRGAYGASVPENVLRPKTNGRILIFDMAKKTLVDQATGQGVASKGPNDTILTSDRDQRPLADHGTYLDRPVIGPDGNPDPTKVYVMKDGNITIQTIPGGGSLGPKPGTTKPTTIPTSEFNKLQGLRVKTASKPGTLQSLTGGMLGSPNEPKPADVEAFRSYAKAEVAKLGIPPTVQSAFNEVIDDPHAENFSSAQVASGFSKLSEAERAILQKVLTEVRGK